MKRIGFLVLMTFLLGASGVAQNTSTAKVLIPVLAKDSHHRLVSGLSAASLVVSERKSHVTEVSIVNGSDLPLELGILIDTSQSVKGEADLDRFIDAARKFANDVLVRPDDRMFFSTFAVKAEATGWLRKEQLAGVSLGREEGRGTALYDSVAAACRERMGARDWSHPTRRVLVVISDGDDDLSHITRDQAVSQALASGVVIFTVGTQLPGPHEKGQRILEYWADITGGAAFMGLTRADVPKAFETIHQMVNGMYYVSYAPPLAPDAVHEVEIKPSPKEKLELSYPRKYVWMP